MAATGEIMTKRVKNMDAAPALAVIKVVEVAVVMEAELEVATVEGLALEEALVVEKVDSYSLETMKGTKEVAPGKAQEALEVENTLAEATEDP